MPKGYRKNGTPLGAKIGNTIRRGKKMPKSSCRIISMKTKGSNNPRWNGGRIFDKSGYILVKNWKHPYRDKTKNYIREHRLIVEIFIGRYLEPRESVHHVDFNKSNNNPTNLIAFTNHGDHTRFERGCKFDFGNIIFDGRQIKRRKYARKTSKPVVSTSK